MGALVVLAAQAGAIEPGAEAETVVLVRNTGDTPDTFHVVVQGDAAPWAVIDPVSVALAPGEEQPVWVRFRPPRSPDTAPGRVPFDIAVAATGDRDFLALEHGVVDVGTYASLAAQLTGAPMGGARWTDLSVRVRNTGNRRVGVSVEAEATARGVLFDVDAPEFELSPGESRDVRVRVRPPRKVLPRTRDRGVTVTVVSDGGALATVRSAYGDDPSLVDELVRSARVLAIVLVVVFVGGLALLRSESTSGDVAVETGPAPATLPVAPTAPTAPAEDEVVVEDAPPEPAEEVPVETVPPLEATRVAAPAPPLPRLVFVRLYGTTSRDLVVREAGAGGRELRLRTDGVVEARPRLSPDGSHIAFVRESGASSRICVVPAAGGEAVCVAETTADGAVAWSADGATLYFSRGGRLFSVAYDGSARTAGPESDLDVPVPSGQFAVSGDGARVVSAEGLRLVVHRLDDGPSTTIEVPHGTDDPSFSPDGTRLVFTANYHVFSAPVAGGAVRQLTAPGTVNGDAAWTGQGDWVVFRSNRSGNGDLYCVKGGSGGGEEVGLAQITETPEREISPSF